MNNHGTYWDNSEQKKLVAYVNNQISWDKIAYALGRSVPACKARYAHIMAGLMFAYGTEEDTLKSWRETYQNKIVEVTK